jgi:hypothetical protein
MVAPQISDNFRIAKVMAILVVVVAHLHLGFNLWVPAAAALFVFGASSAFFTEAKHDDSFQLAAFWRNKLYRLGPNLLVINAFLLGLFLVEGRAGIVTWQTPLSMLGLTGFLNWFDLPNPSPFGAGLWFFTLLLIFYALYPALRLIGRSRWALLGLACASLGLAAILDQRFPMGHALWFTAWSFLFGLVMYRFDFHVPARTSALLAAIGSALLLFLNLTVQFKQLNFFLIAGICFALVLLLKESHFPRRVFLPFAALSGCVLEIYFIHAYLVLKPTGFAVSDAAISLACIILMSLALNRTAEVMRRFTAGRIAAMRVRETSDGKGESQPSRQIPFCTEDRTISDNSPLPTGANGPYLAEGNPIALRRRKVVIVVAGGGFCLQVASLFKQAPSHIDTVMVGPEDAAPLLRNQLGDKPYHFRAMGARRQRRDRSLLGSLPDLILGTAAALRIVWQERPDAVIGIGQRAAVYFCIAARLFGIRTTFVECITRVTKPSATARIISWLRLADQLYVQWPEARKTLPGSIYSGRLL